MKKELYDIPNDMPCDIIRDLLPSYADGLTSDATNEAVKVHIANCPDCSKVLADMSEEYRKEASQSDDQAFSSENAEKTPHSTDSLSSACDSDSNIRFSDLPEIDYMKKIRRKGHRNILLAVLAIVLIFIVGILLKLFVIGYAVTDFYGTNIELRSTKSAAEKEVIIRGQFFDSATVYSRYKVKEHDGIKEVIVYGSLPSFVHKSSSFEIVLPLNDESAIEINGETILADGQRISRLANELYAAKNPYIGDMPANSRLAELLSISSKLGSYTNELNTDEPPYGWELKFGDSWQKRIKDKSYAYENNIDPVEKFNEQMRSYACVLLALIDNCDEIRWSYTDANGDTVTESFDLDDTGEFIGFIDSSLLSNLSSYYDGGTGSDNSKGVPFAKYAIKNFSKSALDVQNLLEITGIE